MVSPVGTGLLLLLASGSPSCIVSQISCVTFPSTPITSLGEANQIILQPSSFAMFNSCSVQGISSCVRLYTRVTSFAPKRLACVAASMAVIPIPITATLSPTARPEKLFVLSSYIKEIASTTPVKSSPRMSNRRAKPTPNAK